MSDHLGRDASSADEQPIDWQGYDVVGATMVAQDDELPLWLRPILRRRDDPRDYWLVQEALEGERGETLLSEDEDYIEEMFAEGRFLRFSSSWPAQPGYWLVQLRPSELPIYLPAETAKRRIVEEGRRHLWLAAQAARDEERAAARRYLGYASRALRDNPLPLLALIALWRVDVSDNQLAFWTRPLAEFTDSDVRSSMNLSGDEARRLRPLMGLIRADPIAEKYRLRPDWLLPSKRTRGRAQLPSRRWQRATSAETIA